MRLFSAGLTVLLLATGTAWAQTFPYEAAVVADGATVHSGPGGRYYATGRLSRGTTVTVHRHEPGGWHMIAPPPGSFSWIRAEYVKPVAAGRGEVIDQHEIVVRVGSSLDDSHSVEQVRLSRGDTVEILGEATLNAGPGAVRMYKIKPPRGEFRWIQGRQLVPTDPALRERHDRNPYVIPSNVRRNVADETSPGGTPRDSAAQDPASGGAELPGFDRPIARSQASGPAPAVRRSAPDEDQLAGDRSRLQQLDEQFRRLIEEDMAAWDFTVLERDYRRLQSEAGLPALASQVDLRLQAIERYRRRQREDLELRRLMSETSRRDAELQALQTRARGAGSNATPDAGSGTARGAAPGAASGEGPWKPTTTPVTAPAAPSPASGQGAIPNDGVPRPWHASQANTINAPPVTHGPAGAVAPPRFDGAGIIQRAAATQAGTPRYVLLAPNGRVLSYLEPAAGLNLEPYIGQSMGILGPRQHRRDLRSDVIIVRGLMPVRLVPAP